MKCETCMFYEAGRNQCRRYPPTMGHGEAWPRTAPDNWCGEYKKAPAAAAK